MSHMRDRFIKALDLSPTGVLNTIAHVNSLLKRVDHQLWQHLQSLGVDPRFYSFRWLTLILSQEFELPDVLRLWDSLFAAEPEASMESTDSAALAQSMAAQGAASTARKNGSSPSPPAPSTAAGVGDERSNKKLVVEFLNDCCVAILCLIRRPLLEADFGMALKALQSAGAGLDVQRVLFKAQEIQRLRKSGGGFVAPSPASKTNPPPPISAKDLAAIDFTAPVPRPGGDAEEGSSLSGAGHSVTSPTSSVAALAASLLGKRAGGGNKAPQQVALKETHMGSSGSSHREAPAHTAGAAANATVAAPAAAGGALAGVTAAASVVSSTVSSVASDVGALLVAGASAAVHAGEAGLHAVEAVIEKSADAIVGPVAADDATEKAAGGAEQKEEAQASSS